MAATILTIVRQVAPEVTAQFPDQVRQRMFIERQM